ncbi:MAG: hypothetical protein ACMG6S_25045 [Byssovorax sp.]
MYLATVVSVAQVGEPPRMEATLTIARVLKGPALPPVTEAVVRYEQPGKTEEGTPAGMSYKLAAGERALVFAPSFEKGFPIEMIAGAPKTVAAEVTALEAYLAAMDEPTARLHGVTPAIRAQQTALYDRVLADLGVRTP